MALIKLHLCAHLREAWTDVGSLGVVRRACLGKNAADSQTLAHLRLDPAVYSRTLKDSASLGLVLGVGHWVRWPVAAVSAQWRGLTESSDTRHDTCALRSALNTEVSPECRS